MSRQSTAIRCLLAAIATLWLTPTARAQVDSSHVASTGMFDFYSRFELNLHDVLYMRSRTEEPPVDSSACFTGLSDIDRRGWIEANAFYREHMAARHHRTDSLMLALRYRLGKVAGASADVNLSKVMTVLEKAAQAYRACQWEADDARNRAWISRLVARLNRHEETIRKLLQEYFTESWPTGRLHIDVVRYASWAGANTVVSPIHLMMSSENRQYQDDHALEMIFHESSHVIMHNGKLRAVDSDPPRNMWHAILFYTVGETTRRVLQASAQVGYTPYMFEYGVFTSYHDALSTHWSPYLDGAVSWTEAVTAMIDEFN